MNVDYEISKLKDEIRYLKRRVEVLEAIRELEKLHDAKELEP